MILHICYNDSCRKFPEEVKQFCETERPEITVFSYDENHYKEKTKAYKIKGGYSARMTPFMLLTGDDKAYVKAFYSEDKGCTLDKLKTFLNKTFKK